MTPAVALIPGFLGFGHDGGLSYFADRFVAGLRAVLEVRHGAPIDVVAVSTLPTASLAARQRELRGMLRRLDAALGPRSWHLVGHSTGGLDAALLLRTHGLVVGKRGSEYADEPLDVVEVGSVVTIAAPHYGTGLATEVSIGHVARALVDLATSKELHARFAFAMAAANAGGSMLKMLSHDDLARDLHPNVAGTLTAERNRRDRPLRSIATWTPPPRDDHPDKLFRDLWRWTAEGGVGSRTPEVPGMAAPPTMITSGLVPTIDPGSNDGVVNTMRQVSGILAGVVVGDHGDVIGRYHRPDLLAPDDDIDPGLLTSGAKFGDVQFFALVRMVADCIGEVLAR